LISIKTKRLGLGTNFIQKLTQFEIFVNNKNFQYPINKTQSTTN